MSEQAKKEREIAWGPIKPEKMDETRKDAIGLFLKQCQNLPELRDAGKIPALDITYLTPEERAESLWALFQDVKSRLVRPKKDTEGAPATLVHDHKLALRLAALKQLYAEPETNRVYRVEYERHTRELASINGNFEKYKALTREIVARETVFNASARHLFSSRGSGTSEMDVLLFESAERAVKDIREKLRELVAQNPELGALSRYATIKEYARELRGEKFIWSSSRRAALEVLEHAALSGRPVLLSGESGTGKTRLVEQVALVLTGRVNSETPGKYVRFQDLIAQPKIGRDGATYYEYKEIGEAATGKEKTTDTEPLHSGRIVADDEFNLLPTAEQTERLARIAAWTPGKRVRMPVTNQEERIGTEFLYCAMVNLASTRYERKKIPPEVLRKFSKVDLDYPPQNAEDPELYEMMLAALLDENGRMRAAKEELEPAFTYQEKMQTIERDGRAVKARVQIRELDAAVSAGGFLWRFANALHELNKSFSHQETALKSRGDAQYVRDLIIDMGNVFGWLAEYRTLGRRKSLEAFVKEKLTSQFLARDAYSKEDRTLVADFFKHFGIDAAAKTAEPRPRLSILTPQDIGLLSPRVQYEKIVKEEPEVAASYFITPEGTRVEFVLAEFREGDRVQRHGDLVRSPDGRVYEFRGVTRDGQPVLAPYKASPEKRKPRAVERGEIGIERAREIMDDDFLGVEAVKKAFGIEIAPQDIPPIPFNEAELLRAKELGQFLILRVDRAPDGEPLTMLKMNALLEQKFQQDGKGKILFKVDWYKDEEFFTTDIPKIRWALVSKENIPNSTNKNYLDQTRELVDYITTKIFDNQELPAQYQEAIHVFEEYHQRNFNGKTPAKIQQLLGGNDWAKYAQELSELAINKLTRQIPAEVIYDLLMYFGQNGRLLENCYTRTSRRSSDGGLVGVGAFGAGGSSVSGWGPGDAGDGLGVSFSRSL